MAQQFSPLFHLYLLYCFVDCIFLATGLKWSFLLNNCFIVMKQRNICKVQLDTAGTTTVAYGVSLCCVYIVLSAQCEYQVNSFSLRSDERRSGSCFAHLSANPAAILLIALEFAVTPCRIRRHVVNNTVGLGSIHAHWFVPVIIMQKSDTENIQIYDFLLLLLKKSIMLWMFKNTMIYRPFTIEPFYAAESNSWA